MRKILRKSETTFKWSGNPRKRSWFLGILLLIWIYLLKEVYEPQTGKNSQFFLRFYYLFYYFFYMFFLSERGRFNLFLLFSVVEIVLPENK